MSEKIVQINMIQKSRSYLDCLYAVLTSARLFEGESFMLAGMSGFAFKFIVHKRLYPSSVDMYNVSWETWAAADCLGIYSETYSGFKNDATFRLYQKAAIRKIKESLDQGRAVIMAHTEHMKYGVIYGYDDKDGVFYLKEPGFNELTVILYENFGICRGACWFYQLFGEKIDLDLKQIYIRSLIHAVDEWETPYKLEQETNQEYASGLKAYDYLIEALKTQNFDRFGAQFLINTYAISKKEIYLYLKEISEELPGMEEPICLYQKLYQKFEEAASLLMALANQEQLDTTCTRLSDIFEDSRELERKALTHLKENLEEILCNRFIDTYEVEQFVQDI